jgi:hypothetical protein
MLETVAAHLPPSLSSDLSAADTLLDFFLFRVFRLRKARFDEPGTELER